MKDDPEVFDRWKSDEKRSTERCGADPQAREYDKTRTNKVTVRVKNKKSKHTLWQITSHLRREFARPLPSVHTTVSITRLRATP